MHCSIRIALTAAALSPISCTDAEDQSAVRRSGADALHAAGHPGFLLLPEAARVPVGEEFRLVFRGGGSLGGPVVTELHDAFDPFMVRVGGYQVNVLVPEVVEGTACVSVRLPEAGHAMAGFSTQPRRIRMAGRDVSFSQHVKTVFHATRAATEVPESSAAMSYRLGLRLEIVPMVDPLALLPNDELPMQVRFDGPELANVEVVFEWLPTGEATARETYRGRTDSAGTLVVPIGKPGRYLATVRYEPRETEMHWAALTFEIGGKR